MGRATTETLTNKTLTSPDINGGTVDGAPIGETTPSTGAFTQVISNLLMNPSTISENFTLAAGYNAISAGPITIGEGVTVTLNDTSNWTIA